MVIARLPRWRTALALCAAGGSQAAAPPAGEMAGQLASDQLIGCANFLILGATLLYLAGPAVRSRAVGWWASLLAALAALGLFGGLLARSLDRLLQLSAGMPPFPSLSDVISLFSALTIVIYLAMERNYRTRSAGAFVMPIVSVAALFHVWLVANAALVHAPGRVLLHSAWLQAHLAIGLLGEGAGALAAGFALVLLSRDGRQRRQWRPGALLDRPPLERLRHQALLLGAVLLALSALLGMASLLQETDTHWHANGRQALSLLVGLNFAAYFLAYYRWRWRGRRMAWWTLASFGLMFFLH